MSEDSKRIVCGGFTEEKPADKEVQKICDQVKDRVEERFGRKLAIFTAEMYRSQVVNGINYLIKVHVGGEDHIHLCVYKMLPCNGGELELIGIQSNKTHHTPIEYD